MNKSIFDAYNTVLGLQDEIKYQSDKANIPFADDSGADYDLRGFWKQYGNLTPTATNGHLPDEYKKPNHPTFSIGSKFYTGQPYAVDWTKEPYKTLGELGIL